MRNARLESSLDEFRKEWPLADEGNRYELETQLKQSEHELHMQRLRVSRIEDEHKSAQQRAVELSLEINLLQKRIRELETANERAERDKKYMKQELTAASSKVPHRVK